MRTRLAGMKHFADVDTPGDELVTRRHDIRDHQIRTLRRAGCDRRDFCAELDRAPGPGWRELDDSKSVIKAEVGVEPPAESCVELLRAVDIRDRNDDDLEFQVDILDVRCGGSVCFRCSHGGFLSQISVCFSVNVSDA